jgi:hypothetical protein
MKAKSADVIAEFVNIERYALHLNNDEKPRR